MRVRDTGLSKFVAWEGKIIRGAFLPDGNFYVAVNDICDVLGINADRQKGHLWQPMLRDGRKEIMIHHPFQQSRRLICIRLDYIQAWFDSMTVSMFSERSAELVELWGRKLKTHIWEQVKVHA